MQTLFEYVVNPIILTILGIIASMATYFLGKCASFRKDRRKIYKEQLTKFYYPVYHKIIDGELLKAPTMLKIAVFYRETNSLFEDNFLLISEEVYRLQRKLKKQIDENDDSKKTLESFKSLEILIQDQYYFLRKKLGYPSISDWQIIRSYPLKTKILFSIAIFLSIFLFLFSEAAQCGKDFPIIFPWYFIISMIVLIVVVYKLYKLF